MAETGMSFDPVVEEPVEKEEGKKKDSKKEKKKNYVHFPKIIILHCHLSEISDQDGIL